MKKTAFVFPGQGAQKFGMGKAFYETIGVSRKIYDQASQWLGMDVPALCFEENDRLDQTHYTQIGLLVTEIALYEAVKERGFLPDVTAGLSLGEYAALYAAGRVSTKDAICLIDKRGLFMQEAVPTGGAMSAVLGLDADTIRGICEETEGIVEVANDNCPGQVVISGEAAAVDAAAARLKEAGAKRVMPLKVSGPFHTRLMKAAGDVLAAYFQLIPFRPMELPVYFNCKGGPKEEGETVQALLERQVQSSVYWEDTIRRMEADGIDTIVEIGPGKTLTSFVKKTAPGIKTYTIDTADDFEKVVQALKGEAQ